MPVPPEISSDISKQKINPCVLNEIRVYLAPIAFQDLLPS